MLRRLALRHLPRHRTSRVLAAVDRACMAFHRAFANLNYDLAENGERFVLEVLARQPDVRTIFDVGANVGEWSVLAAATVPQARIEAFEIVPSTWQVLRERCASLPQVRPHNVGLGATAGKVRVEYSPSLTEVASCVPGAARAILGVNGSAITADVTTGDRFCAEHGVGRVDFLKLDVEGFEPQVLRGFRGKLDAGEIAAIQFEYGYVNAYTGFLLKDFHGMLVAAGMRIGKIFPNRVEFRDYDVRDEDFLGPNYLAVQASRSGLIAELSR